MHPSLIAKLDISNSPDKIKALMSEIVDYLSEKALYEHERQDEHNRTYLSGVGFWFSIDEKTGSGNLVFSSHPQLWNLEFMIDDLHSKYKALLHAKGIALND